MYPKLQESILFSCKRDRELQSNDPNEIKPNWKWKSEF